MNVVSRKIVFSIFGIVFLEVIFVNIQRCTVLTIILVYSVFRILREIILVFSKVNM